MCRTQFIVIEPKVIVYIGTSQFLQERGANIYLTIYGSYFVRSILCLQIKISQEANVPSRHTPFGCLWSVVDYQHFPSIVLKIISQRHYLYFQKNLTVYIYSGIFRRGPRPHEPPLYINPPLTIIVFLRFCILLLVGILNFMCMIDVTLIYLFYT